MSKIFPPEEMPVEAAIHEIECALDLFKRGKFVVWSSVHQAVSSLETEARRRNRIGSRR